MIAACLAFFFWFPHFPLFVEKPIVVLTTSYNNKPWVEKNLNSVFMQDYSNYRVVYIDDASHDGTADIVEQFVKAQAKKIDFKLIRNPARVGALANIYHGIHGHCKDDEIVVSLDGDDWFYDDQVLKKINSVYCSKKVWLTHGKIIEFPSNVVTWSRRISKEVVAKNTFRSHRCPSHLRTFYAWLFKKIKMEDLQYEGKFFNMSWDQAMMFPMIEMAGERHAFIPTLTYVYNISNPINDNKVNVELQRNLEAFIRSKPPYERLEK